jgi:hypothetical protein
MALLPLALFLVFPTALIATWSSVLFILTRRYRRMNAVMDKRPTHVVTLLNSFNEDVRRAACSKAA